MTNDELAMLVLPWAKENLPDAYAATIAVSTRPTAYRNYLVRLVERRWEQDAEWRNSAPLRALQLTGISATFRARLLGDGVTIQVAGEKHEGEKIWTFGELAEYLEAGTSIQTAYAIKQALDLTADLSAKPAQRSLPPAASVRSLAPEPAASTQPSAPAPAKHQQQAMDL